MGVFFLQIDLIIYFTYYIIIIDFTNIYVL